MERIVEHLVNIGLEDVKAALRVGDWEQVQTLVDEANKLISPRSFYNVCYIEQKQEDMVFIDGMGFRSRVLRKNLEGVERVFPFVVTIGAALEQKAQGYTDFLHTYYLDAIGNMALRKAREDLEDHLRSRFALKGLSFMSPGSLTDWPIEEQKPLFSILKTAEASAGVVLTESLLMVPRKSVSGMFFPTEVTFYSCTLCPRARCEGRKAPYDPDLATEYEK